MPKHEITIDVLGCSLSISVEEEPEYLRKLLETYRRKLEEIKKNTGLTDPLRIAILAGFVLCDDAEKIRETGAGKTRSSPAPESGEAEKLTLSLISRLDSLLDTQEQGPGKKIYKLENTVKHYDWGSPEWIPNLLDTANESRAPWAELWMGIHPEGPSRLAVPGTSSLDSKPGAGPLLSDLIAANPLFYLGNYAPDTLPFLFKILAAEKPLSIQAHPSLDQAREGWARENRNGTAPEAPARNYRDANHKPEIICALSPFTAMAGFRQPGEIKELLARFLEYAPRNLKAALFPLFNSLDEKDQPLKKFLGALLVLPREIRETLSVYAGNIAQNAEASVSENDEWALIARFAKLYPGDPAIISPLYLNLIKLQPGEAIYLPAGILHAYVHGLGVELMANSNNVLRGGLTSKHIDLPELFQILDFTAFKPPLLGKNHGSDASEKTPVYRYPVSCNEFSLSVLRGGEIRYPEKGPSIILVTQGELVISGGQDTAALKKGESAFIPANDGCFNLTGDFTLYAAGIGMSAGDNHSVP